MKINGDKQKTVTIKVTLTVKQRDLFKKHVGKEGKTMSADCRHYILRKITN